MLQFIISFGTYGGIDSMHIISWIGNGKDFGIKCGERNICSKNDGIEISCYKNASKKSGFPRFFEL